MNCFNNYKLKALFTILLVACVSCAFAKTISAGKGGEARTLKEAIELSQDGDTIILLKGVYREGNIILDKSIQLIWQGDPVLDGEKKYELLTVNGERIRISGIHFKNSGYSS